MTALPDTELRALIRDLLAEILRESGIHPARVGDFPSASRGFSQRESRILPHAPVNDRRSDSGVAGAGPNRAPASSLPASDTGALPAVDGGSRPGPSPAVARPSSGSRSSSELVDLRTDADLDRFVRRLLELFENPGARAELRAGRTRFRLAGAPRPPTPAPGSGPGATASGNIAAPPYRVPAGAVTERTITEAARAGATTILLGRRAVLTPLAKEKARALGLTITRES